MDQIRGITLISMIFYHGIWDLVFLYGVDWQWYNSSIGYIWQQSICWTFILLSGFCWSLGKNKLKNGLVVFCAGLLVSVVTIIAMPEDRVVFGVLTLLGSSMLIMIPIEKTISKWKPETGLLLTLILFLITRNINSGTLGFEGLSFLHLPQGWYANWITAYLGFPQPTFYSTDYFSLFPWIFLYVAGYFIYRLMNEKHALEIFRGKECRWIEFIGRHSLIIYLLHQPILYLIFQIVMV